jgi:Putative zinc-finger
MSEHFAKGVPSKHATEDALELYIFNSLTEEETETIEVHLLTCELCRMSLASLDDEINLLRSAFQYEELEKRKNALRNGGGKLLMFKLPSASES